MTFISRRFLAALLLSTVFIAPQSAQAIDFGPHKISGGITVQTEHHSNIGAAPSKSGSAVEDEDDIDEDDIEDALDELSDEELNEIIDGADLDGDGLDDAVDGSPSPKSRKDSDWRQAVTADLGHKYAFDKMFTWKSAFKAAANNVSRRQELNRINYAFNTGPSIKLLPQLKIEPSVSYASVYKESNHVTDVWIGSFGAEWSVMKQLALVARYSYQDRDMIDVDGTDAEVDSLKLQVAYKPTKTIQLKFGVSPAVEDASRNTKNKDKNGIEFGYQQKLPHEMSFGAKAKYSETEFDNLSRTDEDTQFVVGLEKKLDMGFFIGTELGYKARNSSVDTKSNHDKSIVLQSGWKF
jgi:hypothetical protein